MKRETESLLGKQGLPSSGKKFRRVGLWRRPRRRTIIAAMAALVLLPIEVSDAGWLSDAFKSSSKHEKSPKHVTSAKPATRRGHRQSPARQSFPPGGRFALNPSALKPVATMCRSLEIPDRSGCRTYRRLGRRDQRPQRRRVHLNLRLAQRIEEKLKAEGFPETRFAGDRGQGQAQPRQARRRGQQYASQSVPVDPS